MFRDLGTCLQRISASGHPQRDDQSRDQMISGFAVPLLAAASRG
jgi:hypothetical protein